MRSITGVLRVRQWVVVAGAVAIGLAASYLLLAASTLAAPPQPIAFNHETMVQKGISCLFCHPNALKSPVAGMPSVEKCMGCHDVIATDKPEEISKLAGYWERQEPIPWERVNHLPRFVYFSHQVHLVAGGLNCERCHGDVGHMAEARPPVVNMDMGWCLSCHQQQTNVQQLMDCVVCHQ